MCLGDWRLGRLIKSVPRNQVVVGPATFDIPHNNQRVALQIYTDAGTILGGNGMSIFRGTTLVYLISPVGGPFYVDLKDHGDAPVHKYTCDPGANTVTVMIVEWFLPEPVLNEALECLQREYKSCKALG